MDSTYEKYLTILKEELVPAMGCTEPIAIAYAAALARDNLGAMPDRVLIGVSKNILKNVKSVIVPNTNGLKGLEAAIAAGIIAGNASKLLEVISEVTAEERDAVKEYRDSTDIKTAVLDSEHTFDIDITVYQGENYARVHIVKYHTNVVLIEKDGEVLCEKAAEGETQQDKTDLEDRRRLSIAQIIQFADQVNIEDVRELLDKQINYNLAIAEEGLKGNYGANIGSTILMSYGNDVRSRAIAKAAAGSDARMSGCELPVVINSGSGNQGIAVSVPVIEYAEEIGCEKNMLYRALVVANLIAVYEKKDIGRLSAFCGAVSAGCAAACGIAYLYGGRLKEIEHTLVNSVVIVSGIICDGAKPSCAAKIASSVEAGILGYHMYMNGQEFKNGDGIVNCSAEKTIENVGRLGRDGMRETDNEIIKIMLDKQ